MPTDMETLPSSQSNAEMTTEIIVASCIYKPPLGSAKMESKCVSPRKASGRQRTESRYYFPMADYVMGVDGCRSGWLICQYEFAAHRLSFDVKPTLSDVLRDGANAQRIAVDIPIGLTHDGQARRCDKEARRMLGATRASSVFPAPARCLLDEPDYPAACRRSLAVCGKKVSQQAFAIFSKIAEVDRVISPDLQAQVFEVHPEVCFWGFEQSAMQHRKKVALGYEERHGLLAAALECAIPQRNEVRRLGFAAEPDDLLDAAVAAFTAYRVAMGRAERIPRQAEFDRRGLRMEMVY